MHTAMRTAMRTSKPASATGSTQPHVVPTSHVRAPLFPSPGPALQAKGLSSKSLNSTYKPIQSVSTVLGLAKRPSVSVGAGSDSPQSGTVAVAGATGLIGSRLVETLLQQGYSVRVLTRNPAAAKAKLQNPEIAFAGPTQWKSAIKGCTAVINMAGEPIATRWSPELKQEIKRSRVSTTKRIAEAINALDEAERPQVLVNASAVGFYGTSETATFNE